MQPATVRRFFSNFMQGLVLCDAAPKVQKLLKCEGIHVCVKKFFGEIYFLSSFCFFFCKKGGKTGKGADILSI